MPGENAAWCRERIAEGTAEQNALSDGSAGENSVRICRQQGCGGVAAGNEGTTTTRKAARIWQRKPSMPTVKFRASPTALS